MKLKKIVALVTASVLCLSMSMTAMADYSFTDSELPGNTDSELPGNGSISIPGTGNSDYRVEINDVVDGTRTEIEQQYIANYRKDHPNTSLTDEEIVACFTEDQIEQIEAEAKAVLDVFRSNEEGDQKRLDIFKDSGYDVPSNVNTVVLATADLEPMFENGETMTDEEFQKRFPNGMTQEINLGDLVGNEVAIGDTIYVLHYDVNTGTWETIPATVQSVNGDAWIEVNFKSLSPVGFVKVMSNGQVIALDQDSNPIYTEWNSEDNEGRHYEVKPIEDAVDNVKNQKIEKWKAEHNGEAPSEDQIRTFEEEAEQVMVSFKEVVENPEKMFEVLDKHGYEVPEGVNAVAIATQDIIPVDKDGNIITNIPKEGITQKVWLGEVGDLETGKMIYVLHYKADDNEWEVIPAEVQGQDDKYVEVTFKSFSPVALVKVVEDGTKTMVNLELKPVTPENRPVNRPVNRPGISASGNSDNETNNEDGKVIVLNETNVNAKSIMSSIVGKSPKTGEF